MATEAPQKPLPSKDVPLPLVSILRDKLIPWTQQKGVKRLLVAQSTLKDFQQFNQPWPHGVEATKRKSPGRRLATRGPRTHGKLGSVTARWPEDGLLAARLPTIIYVVGGTMDFRIGDYCLHGAEGDWCVLPPEVPRSDGSKSHLEGENLERSHCDLLWLRSSEGGLNCWLCHSRGQDHYGHGTGETCFVLSREASSHFMTLTQEAQTRAPGWENICQGLMLVLLTQLLRDMQAGRGYGAVSANHESLPASSMSEPLAYAQQYIRLHLAERLTIEKVSRLVYMTRTQFTTRFRQETGQSFAEFTASCRLEEAKTMLHDTDRTVQIVAHRVGVTPSHLRGLFLKHLKMTPREYQRTTRQQHGSS